MALYTDAAKFAAYHAGDIALVNAMLAADGDTAAGVQARTGLTDQSMGWLFGAGVVFAGDRAWLDVLRKRPDVTTSGAPNIAPYTDPATGRKYRKNFSTSYSSGSAANGDAINTLIGYVGNDGRQWYEGQIGTVYDLAGNVTDTFEIDSFAMDWFDYAVLATIAVITGGAALAALGPAAAAPLGTVETAAVPVSASLGAGESIVVAGDAFLPGALGAGYTGPAWGSVLPGLEAFAAPLTIAGDAVLPGALGANYTGPAWGSVLPGLESYVLPLGATAATAATTAAASSTPGALSTLSSAAGVLSKIAGAVLPMLGLAGAGGSQPLTAGAAPPLTGGTSFLSNVPTSTLVVWACIAAGAVMLLNKKG